MAQLIPLLALGGLYVISNHNKDSDEEADKEGFTNTDDKQRTINYPNVQPVTSNNVSRYSGANHVTDKYFAKNVSQKVSLTNPGESVGSGNMQQMSLTGSPIDKKVFKHNNMVPFFGGKSNGASVAADIAETRLDNMQGGGSQMHKKQEQAPLFKPQTNLQHNHGAPNMNDFLQSRVNPSMRMANTKPWEEERVAPGLGKGFNSKGGNGFNSGMESRNEWLPKTVDQLRVATNPKESFYLAGHEGPANASVKETGNTQTQGTVEKYRPDTYYAVGPSRWNVTTGMEKAPTVRGIEVMHHVNRPETSEEYYGGGNVLEGQASYTKGVYQDCRRPILKKTDVTNVSVAGKKSAAPNDYSLDSYKKVSTNRSTMKQPDSFGAIKGVANAVVAPLLDVMRPSRKENVIGNMRINGNAGTTVSNVRIHNPEHRTKTTIREMTEGATDGKYMNIHRQAADGYSISEHQPCDVQRDTTNIQYIGNAGPSTCKNNQTYDAAYRQRNNTNKTYQNRPNQGGTQIFNQDENISIRRRDADRNNNRMYAPVGHSIIPSSDTYGKLNVAQTYQTTIDSERINPDILSAFKNNPYTQSLTSVA